MEELRTKWGRAVAQAAIGAALASLALVGVARAEDNIRNTSKVSVNGNLVTCSAAPLGVGSSWTPSAFSFDISWVDNDARTFTLADRSHGGAPATAGGLPTAGGDIMVIDINSVNLQDPNPTLNAGAVFLANANDPMAGIACDQNTAFGGTNGVGRNEITGPNGDFTVHHSEVWAGDGPSQFQPGQGHGTATLTNPSSTITSCSSPGASCTYSGVASDYAADTCDSSVRVFDLASRQETDHIDLGGCFRTDEGGWDPVDEIALFANPSEIAGSAIGVNGIVQAPFVSLISTKPVADGSPITAPGPTNRHPVIAQIALDGKNGTVVADMGIEQTVYSRETGLFYTAIPGTTKHPAGYVMVIDPTGNTPKVVKNFALGGNCAPTGAALGPDFEMLLGCSNAGVAEQVIDIRTGKLVKSLTGTSGGCDEVAYNKGNGEYFGACTDITPAGTDDLDVSNSDPPRFDFAINTNTKGAHSVAADAVTVSEWQPASAGTGANAGPPAGLCADGTTNVSSPCVLIFTSVTGAPSEAWLGTK